MGLQFRKAKMALNFREGKPEVYKLRQIVFPAVTTDQLVAECANSCGVNPSQTKAVIDALVNRQRDILDNVCRHLRPGGILVYAVCTITAEECENQVADFLARHPNFRQDALPGPCFGQTPPSQVKFMPHVDGCDGFFVARFVRET